MSLRVMDLNDLNPHLLCVLCGGYLVDATTIVECLHSFCRSCIVKYLQTSFNCPVCDVEVHKTKPLSHIRPDRTLQDIVYKIVPGIYHEEVNRRNEFDANQKEEWEQEWDNSTKKDTKVKESLPFDDPVCITLEYFRKTRNRMEKELFPTRYLRCSSSVTVSVLKKFVTMKFAIPETHITEIIRSDEILDGHLTMKEVCRIYGLYSKPFVDLQYVFLEKNQSTTATEKPKIVEVKRKRIKKRKGKKNLLKKCLSSNVHLRLGNEDEKISHLPPSQESGASDETAPSQKPRPLENERKENLVPSDIDESANIKSEDLVPNQVRSLLEHSVSVDKDRNELTYLNMASGTSWNVNRNDAPFMEKRTVKSIVESDLSEPYLNLDEKTIDSSLMVMSAVNGSAHACSVMSESASGVSNYASDTGMNHISGELESTASLRGLILESS
ncbi:uncharacterized protein [Montipora foliosa]|uniref:uncharacterized protein isoform X2 n=1 Tax=Montipora foliosa TaxID=591990 RepID=UPI0035F155DA